MKRIMGVIFYSLDWTSDLGEDIYEKLFLIKKDEKLLNNHVPSFSFYLTKEFVDEKQYFEISSLPI